MPSVGSACSCCICLDLAVVSFRMAETARNCHLRASQISEMGIFGDPLNQLATFLRCDVTVLEAYRAEAAARNLGGLDCLGGSRLNCRRWPCNDHDRASHRNVSQNSHRLDQHLSARPHGDRFPMKTRYVWLTILAVAFS
jgi:hypothetical protein